MKANKMLILFFVIGAMIACKKNKETKSEIVMLRDKSLAEIKNIVIGNWKIHYSYGGITGNIKTPTPDSYFRVKSNDSVNLTLFNSLVAADKATFTRINTIFGYSAWELSFTDNGGSPYPWIVDMQINDTLILVGNHTNSDGYYMTRIP